MSTQPAPDLELRELAPDDLPHWNRFVAACPEAGLFHRAEWRDVLEDALGYETFFVMAERAGRIEGVLPLAQVESRLFGSRLVSLPLGARAGPAVLTGEARTALEEGARELAVGLRSDVLELRGHASALRGWRSAEGFTLGGSVHALRSRFAGKEPNSRAWTCVATDEVDLFVRLYTQGTLDRGVPPLPRRYFHCLKERFGEDCRILTAERNGKAVAALLSLRSGACVLPCHQGAAVADPRAERALYGALLDRAAEEGLEDLEAAGAGENGRLLRWEAAAGLERRRLPGGYLPVARDHPPPGIRPRPALSAGLGLWRRLPKPLARLTGFRLARALA